MAFCLPDLYKFLANNGFIGGFEADKNIDIYRCKQYSIEYIEEWDSKKHMYKHYINGVKVEIKLYSEVRDILEEMLHKRKKMKKLEDFYDNGL